LQRDTKSAHNLGWGRQLGCFLLSWYLD